MNDTNLIDALYDADSSQIVLIKGYIRESLCDKIDQSNDDDRTNYKEREGDTKK